MSHISFIIEEGIMSKDTSMQIPTIVEAHSKDGYSLTGSKPSKKPLDGAENSGSLTKAPLLPMWESGSYCQVIRIDKGSWLGGGHDHTSMSCIKPSQPT